MFSWNYQDQVADILWWADEDIEDHIVPVPKEHERNSFSKHEKCSKKQKKEENNTRECSKMGSFESENNFFISTMENNCDINKNQDLNDAGMDMDAWPELSNLSMAFCGSYNDRIDRDSFQTGLESKLAGASVLKSVGVGMAGYKHPSGLLLDKGSSLSKPYIHLIGNGMQLDAGPESFGYGDEGNDGFMDYDWSNIEDLDDLDMLLRNNEMIQQANAFLASSTDVISSTSQYITVPEFASCRDHQLDKGSAHQLAEHSSLNHSQKQKMADATSQTEEQTTSYTCLSSESCGKHKPTSCKADMQNLTPVASKKQKKPKDDETCKELHNSRTSKNQQMTAYTKQPLVGNPPQIIQTQSIEQQGSSHQLMIAGCGYPAFQHPGVLLPQQIHELRSNLITCAAFNTNPDCSKPAKPVEPPKQIMTPQEKIEKLRWRQQKQAMLAIQQQREQYNHQNSFAEPTSLHPWQTAHTQDFTESTIAMEQHGKKLPSSESSLVEQIQFPTISSLIDDCIVEENIYHRLKFAMEKLNMSVRLSIRDSLYRLARSSKERQNASDSNSTNRSNVEENISADEESHQHDRSSRMHNLEAVTNPIDRVVAHLLFHTPGPSLLHTADGNMSTTTST